MNEKAMTVVSQIGSDKLETLAKETGNFKTWVRTNKDRTEFLVAGEPTGKTDLIGVVVDFAPNWTRWPDGEEKPEKIYQDEMPDEEDDWKRRCDLTLMTKVYGLVVMDLPFSAFRNFGKYTSDLKIYGKGLSEVLTRAVIGKGKSKKFGQFNTIRFEIAGAFGGNTPKVAALPPGATGEEPPNEAMDVEEDVTPFDDPPPDGGDFVPY